MCGKISAFFIIGLIVFLSNSITEVESGITVGIPPDAARYVIGKLDSLFSCSRFDGYAPCWAKDGGRLRRDRHASSCRNGNIWDYKHTFGFRCWCAKCK